VIRRIKVSKMISNMTKQNSTQSFFQKYKKWILTIIGIQLVPTIIVLSVIIGGIGYSMMNNDVNFHSYKSYIISGFKQGHSDGIENHVSGTKVPWHLWLNYKYDTDKLKEKMLIEKEEYLSQFSESERGSKLAEMKINNIKLPLQKELDRRFTSGLDFYADHVKQRVKREDFASDLEYQAALQDEAWKVGYAHGYREGLAGYWYDSARDSLR
jgi:hypothetical protein